jgi:uncharacterized SAM-binding protein YcdF (DUF218 family)
MTIVDTTSRRSERVRTGRRPEARWRRGATAVLHVAVCVLAVFSFCSGRFDLWIDLRLLGAAGGMLVKFAWAVAVLLLPLCAGPRLAGIRRPRWVQRGWSATWARILLWPTYFFIGCLLANTVYWFVLVSRNVYEFHIPITLLAALLLGLWALFTREWLRVSLTLPRVSPARRRSQIIAVLVATSALMGAVLFFMLLTYQHPPQRPVDLAVVLGNRVLPDGTASVVLEERTVAAIRLYEQGLAKHLFLSGAVWDATRPGEHQLNEAAAMRQVCVNHGLPESAFTLDPIGLNTRATADNAHLFMQAHGYTSAVVCTSNYHLFRTVLAFRQAGIPVSSVASVQTVWTPADPYETVRDLVAIVVYALDPHYRPSKVIAMHMEHPRLVVHKSANTVELFEGSSLFKTYPCITGGNPGDKATEGDRRTPVGQFHIVYKNPQSKFHLSMGLDYPNREDAERGLKEKLITQQQYEEILAALGSDLSLDVNQKKLWYTPLGGEIFLHGHAEGRTGTAGCVALANPDIEELYAILPIGTPVEIKP